MGRLEDDDARKTKLIFIALSAIVASLLVWSVAATGRAKAGLNAAKRELEAFRADNAKLGQIVSELNRENEALKKKIHRLEVRARPKTAKKASVKTASKKTIKRRR